ncbi:sensor domain-containing protein [Kitasatospora sp. NBC_01287]|uniref:sensor histidine kinase n=1 Tax=Kitasatospora sp. NBC_01287 TaxID=2903573 RepID=UPI002251BD6D|nr:sensor domain-containing protein [Kitasatospora sp. NBC_01287]MCX4748112.1 sensor domain-containing protein [Kitasatospora sp. NBC_01287]
MAAGTIMREHLTARSWRERLYSLLSLPLAALGLAAVVLTTILGLLSAGLLFLPMLALSLRGDRALGALYRTLARGLLRLEIAAPPQPPRAPGLSGLMGQHLGDPAAWRVCLYLLIRIPLGVLQFTLGFLWWAYGLLFLCYPLLWKLEPQHAADKSGVVHSFGLEIGGFYFDTWPRALLVVMIGVLVLLTSPWPSRLPLLADRFLMPRLLGPSTASLRLAQLTETRAHAINEAAATLRRIERDLHDGAQARLVALGMRLGRAERQLAQGNTELGRSLIRESRQEAKEIISELRELVSGIHPPALDAGLGPALTTLAARSAIPAQVELDLPERPPAAIETMLYFAAAELLANAGKHSGAKAVTVSVRAAAGRLRLLVSDNGKGGVRLDGSGSGLRGLAERVRVADGVLSAVSPVGGPTTISIELPALG